ncbi:MAG: ACT domain-containing protein, partial [Planctomycetota bacterium]
RFPRVIAIDGYRMEMRPEGHVVIIANEDKPGVLGRYGSVFGANDINIADMTFSRKRKLGLAMVGINLDQAPGDAVMDEIRDLEFVNEAYYMKLPELPEWEHEED